VKFSVFMNNKFSQQALNEVLNISIRGKRRLRFAHEQNETNKTYRSKKRNAKVNLFTSSTLHNKYNKKKTLNKEKRKLQKEKIRER
jgi:hypothetical protein